MTRVLITGATGYIGGHLVESQLAMGRQVRCLVRATSALGPLPLDRIEVVRADLTDTDSLVRAVRGCDIVYHLAGLTSARFRAELYRTNGQGSMALALACARQSTPPRLIVVSTLAAAGTARDTGALNGSHRSQPISDYGRSKRAGELAVIRWARQVPVSIVRPGIVFGERNREMLPLFRSIARFGLHAVPGYWPRRVALIHHADLLEILDRVERVGHLIPADNDIMSSHRAASPSHVATEQTDAGIYLAVGPEFPTYSQLGRLIAQAVGARRMLIMPIAEPIAWLAAAAHQSVNFCRGRSDCFNLDKMREAFAGNWIGSTQRIEQELGFYPPLSLAARLRQAADWYRAQGWL